MKTKIPLRSTGLVLLIVLIGAALPFLLRGLSGAPVARGVVQDFQPVVAPGEPITAEFLDEHDTRTTLARFRGRVVLLNVWATWCGPCVFEMPSLEKFAAAHDSDRFAVVTVSTDKDGRAKVDAFLANHHLDRLTAYLDPGLDFSTAIKVVGFPTTLIIGPDGRELGRIEGPVDWMSGDAADLVQRYLK